MTTRFNTLVDAVVVLSAAGAVAIAAMAFADGRSRPSVVGERATRQLDAWENYTEGGHSLGSTEPLLTIVEFGDYECPSCKRFHAIVSELLDRHPNDVRIVYRHWPLEYHRYALDAARAAECAGIQGRFWQMHDRLYRDSYWLHDAFSRFAAEAGVPDIERFRACTVSDEVDERIQRDVEAALTLQAAGTPALIVNGALLGRIPTVEELETMLATERSKHGALPGSLEP